MIKNVSRFFGPLLGITLLLIAFFMLYHKLSMFSIARLKQGLLSVPRERIAETALLTACYYWLVTGYDTLAFRFIRHPLPYRRIALAAFTGYAFSHNVGMTMLSSGSVRYRIHSSFGLTATETAKVIAFSVLSYWIGCLTVSSVIFLLLPLRIPHVLHFPFHTVRILGITSLSLLITYGCLTLGSKAISNIGNVQLPKLRPTIFVLQMLLGSLDWILASGILFLLLPQAQLIGFPHFFEIFVLAQIAGLLSQVPGGIGVFESILLLLLPSGFPVSVTIGIVLLYRLIFYIVPLMVATALLLTHEVRLAKRKISSFKCSMH